MLEQVHAKQVNPFSFAGEKGEMTFNMTLQRDEEEKTILIKLTHKSKLDKYSLVIGEDYIKQQDNHFSMVVQNVQELFEHIIESFDELTISEDGLIRFFVKLTSPKKQFSKQYQLQTIKINQQDPHLSQLAQEMRQFRQQILEDLAKKDQRIVALQNEINLRNQKEKMKEEENDNFENKFNIFRADLQSKLQKISISSTDQLIDRCIQNNDDSIKQMKKNIEQIGNRVKKLHFDVETALLAVATNKGVIADLAQTITNIEKTQIQQCGKTLAITNFQQNVDNPHRGYFKVKELSNSISITQIQASDGFLNYVSAKPLLRNIKQTFIIKQVQTKICSIYVGIGSKNAFGEMNAMNCKETISYWCYNGQIYKNGNGRSGGRKIHDGETILMSVDMEGWMIDWQVEGEQIQITSIPQHLRNQQLFVFIMMDKKGDTVQITL